MLYERTDPKSRARGNLDLLFELRLVLSDEKGRHVARSEAYCIDEVRRDRHRWVPECQAYQTVKQPKLASVSLLHLSSTT